MTIPKQVIQATDVTGSTFPLNVSLVNKIVSLRASVVEAVITQTVLDEHPLSIFGISKVLLPKEISAKRTQWCFILFLCLLLGLIPRLTAKNMTA
ncbi:hypothetical protein P8452_23866 [Trifolium repens]|nr:hypothetical protein P8452_23866 [Trifolium repens]